MTIRAIAHVEPGTLIRSSFFNDLIDDIADLQAQIDALSGGLETVEITDIDPAGDVPEASTITVKGRLFDVPAVLNTVTLDSTRVQAFLPGSSDTELVFDVPAGMPGVPGNKTLTVVTAQHGSASRTVHVTPAAPTLTGTIVVTDQSGALGKILEDQSYTFAFELNGVNLSASETFRVSAVYDNAVGVTAAEWDANTNYVGTVSGDHTVFVAANSKVTFGVIVKVPQHAKSVSLRVDVVSLHNPDSSGTSQSIPITVNADQPPSSGAVTFELGDPTSGDVTNPVIGGEKGLQIKHAKNPIVQLVATYNAGGRYDHELQIETEAGVAEAGGPWTVDQIVPPIRGYNTGASDILQFKVHAPAQVPADGIQRYLRITATREGTPSAQSYRRFPLVAA